MNILIRSEMDDHQFDDSIKRKVGDYEEPGFDPASLAALHHQMAGITSWPWYSQFRTELIISSGLVIATLLILWSQWFLTKGNTGTREADILKLQLQDEQIAGLQKEINQLRSLTPDTIRVVEFHDQPSALYTHLLYRIHNLEAELKKFNGQLASHSAQDVEISILRIDSASLEEVQGLYGSSSSRLTPRNKDRESVQAQPKSTFISGEPAKNQLSVKTTRDLEKHYRKGIGIRLGPTLELSKGIYPSGKGDLDVTGGVLADFILSPSFSLETGVKYVHRFYEISNTRELSGVPLPGVDESLGRLINADVDSWIFELPLNLRYWYPLSVNTRWLAGLGYSSLLYSRQVFEYDYQVDNNPSISVNSAYNQDHTKLYRGALNFSLGLSNQLRNKKTLETTIYYQHSLGELGEEKTTAGFLGVKGVYWFSIK